MSGRAVCPEYAIMVMQDAAGVWGVPMLRAISYQLMAPDDWGTEGDWPKALKEIMEALACVRDGCPRRNQTTKRRRRLLPSPFEALN